MIGGIFSEVIYLWRKREGNCPACNLIVEASCKCCVHCKHVFSPSERSSIMIEAEVEHSVLRRNATIALAMISIGVVALLYLVKVL